MDKYYIVWADYDGEHTEEFESMDYFLPRLYEILYDKKYGKHVIDTFKGKRLEMRF